MTDEWAMIELSIMERLDEIKGLIEKGRLSDRWVSLNEAVRYSSLSESTLRRAIRAGRLRASKSTGKIMLRLSWIDRFLGS